MAKVRIELALDFGPTRGQVLSGVVVNSDYDSVLKAVQNKLKLKKKDVSTVTLYCADFAGVRVLPRGDLRGVLHNGAKVLVCHGEPTEASQHFSHLPKKLQEAVDRLPLVPVGTGSLSARGRPSLETLAALQRCRGVTGLVTLLRHDECQCEARRLGQACEQLGLKWCHAPLPGPERMGMTGGRVATVTQEDLESFRKIREVGRWLDPGGERVVVHCAAGLHRTGVFLYALLRGLGEGPQGALDKIRQIREATFNEFMRLNFLAKAEDIFAVASADPQDVSSVAVSAVRVLEGAPARGGEAEDEEEEDAEAEECAGEDAPVCAAVSAVRVLEGAPARGGEAEDEEEEDAEAEECAGEDAPVCAGRTV